MNKAAYLKGSPHSLHKSSRSLQGALRYLRSRRITVVIITAATVSMILWVVNGTEIRPASQSEFIVPTVMLLPLIPAFVVSAAACSPAPNIDIRAGRALAPWRLAVVLVFTIFCILMTSIATLTSSNDVTMAIACARNTVGFIGLGLICAWFFGEYLAWMLPLAWIIIPAYTFVNVQQDKPGIFSFYAQPGLRESSGFFAITVFIVGLILITAKEPAGGIKNRLYF